MYCPSCGKTTSLKQRYCRSCGLDLEDINRALAKKDSEPGWDKGKHDSATNLDWLKKAAYLSCVAGFALIALSIILLLVTVYIPEAVRRGSAVGVMVSTAILLFLLAAMFALPYAYYKRFHKRRAGRHVQEAPSEMLRTEGTTQQLSESSFEPLPSVVERTTELLGTPGKREDD